MVKDSSKTAQSIRSIQSTLLDRLKEETRDVHEELERQLPLTSPHLTIDQYRQTLECFYTFYRPFEATVLPRLPADWAALFQNRYKGAALLSDLRFLGSSHAHASPDAEMPFYTNLPQILGALYVIEGSTLGGQLISRHVQRILGFPDNEGLQFFSSYGAEVGSRWRSFRQLLQSYSSPQSDSEIVTGARHTFQALQKALFAISSFNGKVTTVPQNS